MACKYYSGKCIKCPYPLCALYELPECVAIERNAGLSDKELRIKYNIHKRVSINGMIEVIQAARLQETH